MNAAEARAVLGQLKDHGRVAAGLASARERKSCSARSQRSMSLVTGAANLAK